MMKKQQQIEYTSDVQKLFLRIMLSKPELYTRISNIFNVENFDKTIKPVAEFINQHASEYKCMPAFEQIHAVCEDQIEPLEEFDLGRVEWFLVEFEKFTKQRELERAIIKSADLLEQGNYDPVEKLIKDAVQISMTRDMGTDYFSDPQSRLEFIKNGNGQVSTGWPNVDKRLYGGFNRGELNIFAGGSGSGKSLFMQNLSVNWLQEGLNGVYITLELSEQLCSWRMDSMVTGIPAKQVFKNIDDVVLRLKMASKKMGKFRIKYLPAQSTVNDIRAYVKSLEIETGIRLDFMCIDYLDLLMPVSTKVSPSDLFIKDKYVSEEIRNLAKELNVVLVTASQLNRGAVEEIEYDHSHISGGISKINTADNVFGIFTSRHMRETGKYQIQFMKTRSSSGVGQKVDLGFDNDTLRIVDTEDPDDQQNSSSGSGSLLNKIRQASSVVTPDGNADQSDTPIVRGVTTNTALKQMLNSLKPQF